MNNYNSEYWAKSYVKMAEFSEWEELEPTPRTLKILQEFEELFNNENVNNPS
jgi:hypothetical protein